MALTTELIDGWQGKQILVVGDLCTDRYVWGSSSRLSPEAPVPILQIENQTESFGMAGNVVSMVHALGGEARLYARHCGTKTRYMASVLGRDYRQVLRIDSDRSPAYIRDAPCLVPCGLTSPAYLPPDNDVSWVTKEVGRCDACIVSDYDKGFCHAELIEALIQCCAERHVPMIADLPDENNLPKYDGCQAVKLSVGSIAHAYRVLDKLLFSNVLLSANRHGMLIWSRPLEVSTIEPTTRNSVDPTGCGDQVMAVVGLAMCAGSTWREACELANAAGGMQAERLGCSPVSALELAEELKSIRVESKILSEGAAVEAVANARTSGKRVAFTNGCFDLLHPGHMHFLRQAALCGDFLVVAVNSDKSVRELKGQGRPAVPCEARVRTLASLDFVDIVLTMPDQTPDRLLNLLKPDVLAKGGSTHEIIGQEIVRAYGGKIFQSKLLPGFSSTAIQDQITGPCLVPLGMTKFA